MGRAGIGRAGLLGATLLWSAGCGTTTQPIAGSTSSTGSSISSAGSSSAGTASGSTGSSGTSGSSGASGSSGSNGSGGSSASSTSSGAAQPGTIQGNLTYNARALARPGYLALYDHSPLPNDAAQAVVTTDATGDFTLGPLDGGPYWLIGAYSPGPNDGGPVYPDGGLWPGYVAGDYLEAPVEVNGNVLGIDLDLSPLVAVLASITVNASQLPPDAGLPPGGQLLPDGGLLYPVLVGAAIGGTNPETGLPINDATAVTAMADGGPEFTLAYSASTDPQALDYHRYAFIGQITPLSSVKPASAGPWYFQFDGSSVIGGPEERQVTLTPLQDVPAIAAPADHSRQTGSSVQVAWVDAVGTSAAEVKAVRVASDGTQTTVCDLAYPQTSPITLGPAQGCTFVQGTAGNPVTYQLQVLSTRVKPQPQGATLEAAFSEVTVTF